VVGVDASQAMLEIAAHDRDTDFVLAVAERLPFPDATFDLATVSSAIHWFPSSGVTELRRVLADGSRLLVYDVWFRAEMQGEERFEEWLSTASESRYPPLTKHSGRDLTVFGFESQWTDDIHRDIEMTAPQLVSYLMTHSERIDAVRTGRESEEEQARFLADGVAPFYGSTPERTLGFGIKMELFRAA
jgi:ubiquinone/menaquinone biosynthesis C-methylase UbiE